MLRLAAMFSLCFNPFFIRASVYWIAGRPYAELLAIALFQSLLHQGISLLGVSYAVSSSSSVRRFNPFFIRASVY